MSDVTSTVLSEGAKRDLLDLIKRAGTLGLDDAARELKLAKTTVRQHLLAMETQGLVRRRYERAGLGRPKVVFELSREAQRLYPTQEPTLLKELLEHLKSSGQSRSIRVFFERYWAKRREHFETLLASLSPGKAPSPVTRLDALRRFLESEGFMPSVEREANGRVIVRECNCPFQEAIQATQLPCKLESEFINWALKADLSRTGYIGRGDAACTYSGKKTK